MSDDNVYWNQWRAWKVNSEKLPKFLNRLQRFGSPYNDGNRWARNIDVKPVGSNEYMVTAQVCSYPYCDNELRDYL